MRDWLSDLQYGGRMIAQRPGTSAIAVLALALGIGLTTVMFSIVHGVMLRGLPFPDGDRIMRVTTVHRENPDRSRATSLHDLADWRARQRSFESLAAYASSDVVAAGDGGWPERFEGVLVTANLFAGIGTAPIMGRDLRESDAMPGAPPVAIIGHRMWQTRYEGNPGVLGTTVRLNGITTQIVGVMPARFGFPESGDLWLPLDVTLPVTRGDGRRVLVLGRLKAGVSVTRAETEMLAHAQQLEQVHPANKDLTARVRPFLEEELGRQVADTLSAMLVAVFGVMLIACVNVTNLQFARAAERAKETAIRTALGSGRWRIIRQALAEGLILSVLGSALGLALTFVGTAYFMGAIASTNPPFWIDVRVDPAVLLFVAGLAVTAALVSSVVPGWRMSRADANAVLKDETRGATGLRMGRFTRWLVVVEVAVSCLLLVVSGLMVRSILATSRLDHPFATKDVFHAGLALDREAYADGAPLDLGLTAIVEALANKRGVRAVALATGVPDQSPGRDIRLDGVTYANDNDRPSVSQIAATPGFFDVLRVTPLAGRVFAPGDGASSLPVAVVDQAFVSRHMSGASPLGRRLQFGSDQNASWFTIVGVVPTLGTTLGAETGETVYVPLAQLPQRNLRVLAASSGDPIALTPALRRAASELNEQLALSEPMSLAGEYWRQGWPFRLFGGLFLAFGVAALLLAAVGLYGVMSFSVRRRTQEIGVRMALGAQRRGILSMVMWQGLWRVAFGVVLGLWPGWFLGSQLTALLEDIDPADPLVHGVTAATLMIAGGLACLAPALRASSVDPLTALKN